MNINVSICHIFMDQRGGRRQPYSMQRMEAECCIFMLFFRLRMLSEDWYTWMLKKSIVLN